MSGAYKYRPQYTQNTLGPSPEGEKPITVIDRHRKLAAEIQQLMDKARLVGSTWSIELPKLLADFERQVRLEEAEWWAEGLHGDWKLGGKPMHQDCTRCQRIATLRAASAEAGAKPERQQRS